MSYGDWPTLEEIKALVDVDPNSTTFDVHIADQLAAAIQLVKDETGAWDDLLDVPDQSLAAAARRAAYLLSLKETPQAIVNDEVFRALIRGHRRRFSFA